MMSNFIGGFSLTIQLIVFSVVLFLGAFFLIKCCDIFIDSASIIAKKFKIPSMIIGLTIVAIGTSIPEFAVTISDSISSLSSGNNANIGFSNVIGSNISNLLLVLSFSCLFTPIIIKKETKLDYKIVLSITILLTIFSLFFGVNSILANNAILRVEAIILIFLSIFYIIYVVINCKSKVESVVEQKENIHLLKPIILLIIGIVGIAIGGKLVVYGAKGIASNVSDILGIDKGLSEALIGLTIVAVGTSLPELVTTIIASKKGDNDMALGNVIGSNIFNIILGLGIAGTISPFTISNYMLVDLFVLFFVTILVFIFVLRGNLNRRNSVLFLTLYFLYIIYLIIRTI